DCFPPSLHHRVSTAPTNRGAILDALDEPIAADARAEGDGPDTAFLKIIAGLLGVDLTALEEKTNEILAGEARRARRIRNIFAGLALFSGLLTWAAYEQRQSALEVQSNYIAREALRVSNEDHDQTAAMALALEALPAGKDIVFPRRQTQLATQA